jgi:Ca2+-binding EF-hand superfamily protein
MDAAVGKVLDHGVDMDERLAPFQLDAEEKARAAADEHAVQLQAAALAVDDKKKDFASMMRLVRLGLITAPKLMKCDWDEELSDDDEEPENIEDIDQLVDGWMVSGHEAHRKDSPQYVGEDARSTFFKMFREDVHLRNHGLRSPRSKSLLECNRLQVLPRPLGVVRHDIAVMDLHCTGMGNTYCTVFAESYKYTRCIRTLNVADNSLQPKGIVVVLDAMLSGRSQVADFNISRNTLTTHADRESSCLVQTKLAMLVLSSTSLIILNLEHCKISDAICVALCHALQKNRSLKKLNLCYNQIGQISTGPQALKELLAETPNIQNFGIAWNKLSGDGATMVAQGLSDNSSIDTFDMSWNSFGSRQPIGFSEAAIWIAQALKSKLSKLTHLDISHCKLGYDDCKIIAEGIRNNHSLLGIHVDGNQCVIDAKGVLHPCIMSDNCSQTDDKSFHSRIQDYPDNKSCRPNESQGLCWLCDGWVEYKFDWDRTMEFDVILCTDNPEVFLKEQTQRYKRAKDKVEMKGWLAKAHELSVVTDSDESDDEDIEYAYDKETESWKKRHKGGNNSSSGMALVAEEGEECPVSELAPAATAEAGIAEPEPEQPSPDSAEVKKNRLKTLGPVTDFDGQNVAQSGNACHKELDSDLFAEKHNSGRRSSEVDEALARFARKASKRIDAHAVGASMAGKASSQKENEKELRQQLAVERDMELFRCFDKDGDGFLDAYEVAAALRSGGYHLTSKEIDKILVRYDWNGNSKIDFGELRTLAKNNRALRKTLGLSGSSSQKEEEQRPAMPNVTLHLSIDNYKGEKMVSKDPAEAKQQRKDSDDGGGAEEAASKEEGAKWDIARESDDEEQDEGPYEHLNLDKGKGAFQVARMLPPSRVDYFFSSRVSDGDQKYPPLYMIMVMRDRPRAPKKDSLGEWAHESRGQLYTSEKAVQQQSVGLLKKLVRLNGYKLGKNLLGLPQLQPLEEVMNVHPQSEYKLRKFAPTTLRRMHESLRVRDVLQKQAAEAEAAEAADKKRKGKAGKAKNGKKGKKAKKGEAEEEERKAEEERVKMAEEKARKEAEEKEAALAAAQVAAAPPLHPYVSWGFRFFPLQSSVNKMQAAIEGGMKTDASGKKGGKKGKKGGAAVERERSPSLVKAETAMQAAQAEDALSQVTPGHHTAMPVPAVVNTIMVQPKDWFECEMARPRLRRYELFSGKVKFCISQSIFAPRAQETDSGTFWDTDDTYTRCFTADWDRSKVHKFLPNEVERNDVYNYLKPLNSILIRVFKHFSCQNPKAPFSVGLNEYRSFVLTCDFVSDKLKLDKIDLIFTSTNVNVKKSEAELQREEEEKWQADKAEQQAEQQAEQRNRKVSVVGGQNLEGDDLSETVGSVHSVEEGEGGGTPISTKKKKKPKKVFNELLDMKAGDNSTNNLVRYEFMECLVRIALAKYGSDPKKVEAQAAAAAKAAAEGKKKKWVPQGRSPMQAVEKLMEVNVLPVAEKLRLGPHNPINEWRDKRLYTLEVRYAHEHALLAAEHALLAAEHALLAAEHALLAAKHALLAAEHALLAAEHALLAAENTLPYDSVPLLHFFNNFFLPSGAQGTERAHQKAEGAVCCEYGRPPPPAHADARVPEDLR